MTLLDSSTRRVPIPVGTLLLLTGATVGWGVGATLTRHAVSELAPFTVALFRFGFGAAFLMVLLAQRGTVRGWPPRRDWPTLLLLGLLGVTIFGGLYALALQWTSAAEGTLIHGIIPMVTLGLAAVLLREPISRTQIMAGLVAFAGLAILLFGSAAEWGGTNHLLGDLLMLGAAFSWSGYSVAVRKSANRFCLDQMSAYSVLIGAVLLVPLALAEPVRLPFSDVSLPVWLSVVYLAVVSCCFSYLWWNEGVRAIGVGRAAGFTFLVPVAAMLSAIPILGEWPGLVQLIGGAVILSGLFIANRP